MPIATPLPSPTALMITGPTGIGKTALALQLARRFPLEIISADSMQVYRGMEIGTAQPNALERSQARFHVCGVLDPEDPFNVQRFIELCDAARRDILARGRVPLYVGGTGLYLRALRWGLFEQPVADPAVRRALEREAEEAGAPALHGRLAALDPVAAARIAPGDAVRIVRALEVHVVTGRPLSELQAQWDRPRPRFPHVMAVLVAPREVTRRRIAERARQMLDGGWIEEVRALLARGVAPARHCFKALGYREVIAHVEGRLSRTELEKTIIDQTNQFSRRQMVWLRRERPAVWIAADPAAPMPFFEKLLEMILDPSV